MFLISVTCLGSKPKKLEVGVEAEEETAGGGGLEVGLKFLFEPVPVFLFEQIRGQDQSRYVRGRITG